MPAVLNDVPCEACRGRHSLCLPRSDALDAWRGYEYECPVVGRTVLLPLSSAGEKQSKQRVRGAVILRQVTCAVAEAPRRSAKAWWALWR